MAKVGLPVLDKPHQSCNTKKRVEEGEVEDEIPTALNLTGEKQSRKSSCVFCVRIHDSTECFQVYPSAGKERHFDEERASFPCLRQGQWSAECKTNRKYLICGMTVS